MNILAIRYSGLGDIVMLLPTLKALKKRHPDSKVTLLCDKTNAQIKELSCGIIDDVVALDRNAFRQKRVTDMLREIKKIISLRGKYDVVYDFQSFGETAMLAWLVGAKERIGALKKEKYRKFYTKLRPYDTSIHRSKHFARIAEVEMEGAPEVCIPKNVTLSLPLQSSKKTIGLNIGSTQESRRWSEENFKKLGEYFLSHYNVMVFFGPLEKRFLTSFDDRFIKIYDQDLVHLAYAIKQCDLFISNDTGPVHLAAALHVPTVTLFSTGEDWQVGCMNEKKEFIRKNPISAITVEEVIEKSERLLDIA
ncbi:MULTISPECIES: glycosyltransferase family 9 protein [unclassified Nitratiruptor]|uniref:glycosyltransferase family 9 protein n=1 Tax=unclassified Nitratiruptor TaxID=2624044 RepID=UPI0019385691|nr:MULTISPECIES: glycosyltransferase family 9 protein [unclassified Nitratiruptor]BCD60747.1 glycosyl transferase, family 9 [Nitratiruptor sp. YY08-10]BCD64679.1 glycosyl transferase, family 9 [Nitratiruptor sp. YY08-14]